MSKTGQPILERVLRRVPFVSYVIRLLETENIKELALFTVNALGFGVVLVSTFGYPAFILLVWTAVILAASSILLATLG